MSTPLWSLGQFPWIDREPRPPRARVIIDNDFAGDPDDLYQVVHHLLSPGVEIPLVVCSHLREGDPFSQYADSAEGAEAVVRTLFDVMRLADDGQVVRGASRALTSRTEPQPSAAAEAIVAEAMRDDTGLPLFAVFGGGLTELASAWLMEPRIAQRMTVIWIGGPEYETLGWPPPGPAETEYNLAIDVIAGQVVFNDSDLVLWQVPRNMYRQCLVSDAELRHRVRATGVLGRHLYDALDRVRVEFGHYVGGFGETYALGDSPLVLLTVLQSFFQPDPASSDFVIRPCPRLDDEGAARPSLDGRPVRVYTRLDVRLMFEDMFTKIAEFDAWLASQE